MAPRLLSSSTLTLRSATERYICPSCAFQQKIAPSQRHRPKLYNTKSLREVKHSSSSNARLRIIKDLDNPSRPKVARAARRHASNGTLASSTAINPPSHVPSQYQDIHARLKRLEENASGFADLARLRLAIKGYETEQARYRIAFLTLNDENALVARKLARALLSDALDSEQAWEQELVAANGNGQNILLKFGHLEDLTGSTSLFKVMPIPSAFLEKHRLEILIAPLLSGSLEAQRAIEDVEDALLVPALTIPAADGRVGFVRSPVHKTLVIASGVDDVVQAGQLNLPLRQSLMALAVDNLASATASAEALQLNTDLATEAINTFRRDAAAGGEYGNAWLSSHVTDVSEWLTAGLPASSSFNAITVRDEYLSSSLDAIEQSIDVAEITASDSATGATIPDTTRDDLSAAIDNWSADAHQDLRDNLLTAFESAAWKRTAWFRLLWRIDDVSYSTSDILNQCWLSQTEQRLAYLTGRIRQAGLADAKTFADALVGPPAVISAEDNGVGAVEAFNEADEKVIELAQSPVLYNKITDASAATKPWPQTIDIARQTMLDDLVPAMHRAAQGLVLSTLSTVGAISALGGWWWVASGGSAIYEAGAIIAFGVVWTSRRLQKKWGKERDDFAVTTQENGRRVLTEIETKLRDSVRTGGRSLVRADDVESFAKARAAVQSCRDALAALRQ